MRVNNSYTVQRHELLKKIDSCKDKLELVQLQAQLEAIEVYERRFLEKALNSIQTRASELNEQAQHKMEEPISKRQLYLASIRLYRDCNQLLLDAREWKKECRIAVYGK